MKKWILLTIAVLCISTHSYANTNSLLQKLPPKLRIYAGGKLGYNQQFIKDGYVKIRNIESARFSPDSPSMGIGLTGGVEYQILPNLFVRGELEYMYRIPTQLDAADSGTGSRKAEIETQLHTILINGYLDYYLFRQFSIFASLGMGAAVTNARAYNIPSMRKLGNASSFAIQVGFGAAYNITKNILIDLNLRYLDVMSYKTERAKFPLSAVELIAGVRYIF